MTREAERKVGGRTLRTGDWVKIRGLSGAFRIVGFRTGIDEVDLYGGRAGYGHFRTVTTDRIGSRPRSLNSASASEPVNSGAGSLGAAGSPSATPLPGPRPLPYRDEAGANNAGLV